MSVHRATDTEQTTVTTLFAPHMPRVDPTYETHDFADINCIFSTFIPELLVQECVSKGKPFTYLSLHLSRPVNSGLRALV